MKVLDHPHGFLKIVLREKPDGSSYRIHVWDELERDRRDIHQHRGDFTSEVIEGSMAEEIYDYEDCADGGYVRLFTECRQDDSGAYHIDDTAVSRCRVRLVRTEQHKAGETYFRGARDLHRVIAVTVPLITLVTCGPTYQEVHTILRARQE